MTTIPTVTVPITPPNRVNASEDYDQETHAFRLSEIQMAEDLVAAVAAINIVSGEIANDASAASDDAAAALASAGAASDSAGNAAASETNAALSAAAAGVAGGVDVSAQNNGDLLQVTNDGGKALAMSSQRLENSASFTGTTPSLDIAAAQYHYGTLTDNTTFTFDVSNFGTIANNAIFCILEITQDSTARTITFPASVDWDGGVAPDAPATDEKATYTFVTRDGGTTWLGSQYGANFS